MSSNVIHEYNITSKYIVPTYKITTLGVSQVTGNVVYDRKNNITIIKYFKLLTTILLIIIITKQPNGVKQQPSRQSSGAEQGQSEANLQH